MAGVLIDPSRAPVAFGRRAVPQLFGELQQLEADRKQRALASLCDLMHDPEKLYQAVTGGFVEQLEVLFKDEDSSLLDDSSSSCRRNVHRVLNRLARLPAGTVTNASTHTQYCFSVK
ncbi:radial spoke head 14 homolog [Scomber scombrus]|uniref:Radial spoke head 14 homolog n=1 Tax=Scomber scombrus TaxID=13677 RepID=A0AAV1QA50_SCOSC